MQVSDPRGLTFVEWSTALVSDNGIALNPATSEEGWEDWIIRLYDELNVDFPNPTTGFADWSSWVDISILTLEQVVISPVIFVGAVGVAAVSLNFGPANAGAASGLGLMSFWIFINPTGGVDNIVLWDNGINQRMQVSFNDATQVFTIALIDVPNFYVVTATANVPVTSQWTNVLLAYDVGFPAGSRVSELWLNGVQQTLTPFTDAGAAFTLTPVVTDIELLGGGAYAQCFAQFWYGYGQFSDLTIPNNVEAFYDGGPVDLGAIGEIPTGTSPTIYLAGSNDDFLINRGTLGGTFLTGGPILSACGSGIP